MSKKTKGLIGAVMWIIGLLITLVIAGLFLDGTSQSNVLLKYLPAIVHTFAGWILIASVVLTLIMAIYKRIK